MREQWRDRAQRRRDAILAAGVRTALPRAQQLQADGDAFGEEDLFDCFVVRVALGWPLRTQDGRNNPDPDPEMGGASAPSHANGARVSRKYATSSAASGAATP